MWCVPALFVVCGKFTKFTSFKSQKISQLISRRTKSRPDNWMTVRMGYDSATTSPMGTSRTTLRWDSEAGTEKRHSEKTANNPQIFQETVPFYTRDFSYLWGSRLTVKTVIFRRFLFVGAPNGLRIVCGISIRKSVNSAGLEQDFFRQKQAFYLCCDYRYHDPKCDYD